jgi:hypothetical protein
VGHRGLRLIPAAPRLFAVYQTAEQDSTKVGLNYLKTEICDYWAQRENLVEMLGFLGRLPMPHWRAMPRRARLLAGALANDHVGLLEARVYMDAVIAFVDYDLRLRFRLLRR